MRKMTGCPGRSPQTSAPLIRGSGLSGGVRMPSCAVAAGSTTDCRASVRLPNPQVDPDRSNSSTNRTSDATAAPTNPTAIRPNPMFSSLRLTFLSLPSCFNPHAPRNSRRTRRSGFRPLFHRASRGPVPADLGACPLGFKIPGK